MVLSHTALIMLRYPSPGDLSDPEIEPMAPAMSSALQVDSLPLSHWGKPSYTTEGWKLINNCSEEWDKRKDGVHEEKESSGIVTPAQLSPKDKKSTWRGRVGRVQPVRGPGLAGINSRRPRLLIPGRPLDQHPHWRL